MILVAFFLSSLICTWIEVILVLLCGLLSCLLLQECYFAAAFLTKSYPVYPSLDHYSDSKNSCSPCPLEQNLPPLLHSFVNSQLQLLVFCYIIVSHNV